MDMSIDLMLLGVTFVLFLVGTVLLWKILGKPLVKVMDERVEKIRSDLEQADAARIELEDMKVEYSQKVTEMEARATEMISQATKKASIKAKELHAVAQEEIDRSRAEALKELEVERIKAIHAAKNEIADLAIDVAKTVLSREVSKEDHDKYIDEFLVDIDKRTN